MTTIKCIDDQMRRSWKNYKYKLHSHLKSIGGENDVEMAKKKRHPELKDDQQNDWEMLCDRWYTNEFKVISILVLQSCINILLIGTYIYILFVIS